ncbi:MAG: PIN domain-containing protein [Paucibacter sp.]|nr:PIN domain-containing protein [Roseateles sp.]
MLVVDSSVWIDHFNDMHNAACAALRQALAAGDAELCVPDLVLFEVMRGIRFESERRRVSRTFGELTTIELGGHENVMQAADHYRQLRRLGRTVRSSIDMLLASWCLTHDHVLLQRDRDFLPYAEHLGLRLWPLAH